MVKLGENKIDMEKTLAIYKDCLSISGYPQFCTRYEKNNQCHVLYQNNIWKHIFDSLVGIIMDVIVMIYSLFDQITSVHCFQFEVSNFSFVVMTDINS